MARPNKGPYLSDEPNEYGYYEIRWTERGRSRRRSTGTADYSEAQKVLAVFILEGGPEAARGQNGLSVARAIADYWREHVESRVASKRTAAFTAKLLAQHFCAFSAPEFDARDMTKWIDLLAMWPNGMLVTEIEPEDVERYVRKRRAGKIGKGASDATIRHDLGGFLVPAINHAIKMRRLRATEKPHIPLPEGSPPTDRWLTEEEAARLFAAAQPPSARRLTRLFRFLALALNTAARSGALRELTWFQVDLDRQHIHLNPPGRRQTKKRRPTVPISDELLPILKRAKAEAINEYVLDHPGEIRKSFERAAARAGLEPDRPWRRERRRPTEEEWRKYQAERVTPHVLRHTWATWAAQHGTDLWKVAGMLGDTLATTEARYAHHHPDHLRDAANFRRAKRNTAEEVEEG